MIILYYVYNETLQKIKFQTGGSGTLSDPFFGTLFRNCFGTLFGNVFELECVC